MAQIIGLPKLSPTMEEGVLVRWTKKEGDKVSPGDLVAEVETDKANMDFNIEDEGVLLKFLVKEGDTVKLGAPVAIIGKAGEDITALIEQANASGGTAAPAKPAAKQAQDTGAAARDTAAAARRDGAAAAPAASGTKGPEDSANAPAARREPREATRPEQDRGGKAAVKPAAAAKPPARPAAASGKPPAQPAPARGDGRLLASPLAKTLAIELGIDLRQITGSGPGGRIIERDVRAAAEGKHNGHAEPAEAGPDAPPEAAETGEYAATGDDKAAAASSQALVPTMRARAVQDSDGDWDDVAPSNMRKRIAARLTEAKRDVPHFYLMRDLDAAALLAYRQRLNDLIGDRPGATKISVNDLVIKAVALALRRMPECNASWQGDALRRFHRVHVGVAVAIPEGLVTPVVRDADMKGIGAIAAEIKDLAERARSRSLKAHEITGSTFSVSNLGMFGIERFTAIINPPEGGILAVGAVRDAAVVDKGTVVAGKRMTVTMSCDHRVIDGALGARWLTVLAELIEKPESLAL
ncbi:MAG: pyruvate dehydrogenase complex dihydrolipoamide acetyltransferase [Deltaproteobacteria bacterium]|nr:MAG: pyruvate dehydrogenase complex dihydrolipoamide acetyltransferase [Deltaproteobacteria bacterium]